mgnify:CR=1 FL=1
MKAKDSKRMTSTASRINRHHVASLNGALGVPTYKALHYRSWMSLGADREPFMPAVMCVTPPHAGQWRQVFEQVLSRLG